MLLQLIDVRKNFGQVVVLDGINLSVERGSSVAILGPSGSGKTTLLQICGLLDYSYTGKVLVDGAECRNSATLMRRKYMGFVYQNHHLMQGMTALENVMLPALISRQDKSLARQASIRALAALEIYGDKIDRKPQSLSGGENQRVAIARAFCCNPAVLMADEPTGSLDEKNASLVFDLLLRMSRKNNTALIVITHNESMARKVDIVLRLHGGRLT